jgi:RND family efflux transporter MFP subunit
MQVAGSCGGAGFSPPGPAEAGPSIGLWAAVTASLLALACGSGQAQKTPGPAAAAGQPATVDAVVVVANTLNVIVPLPGELQAYETVAVYPRVSGFVKSIAVDRGSHVTAGQVVARLEAPELLAQRAEAQAKLQSAAAQLVASEARLASDDATYQHLKTASATPGAVAGNALEVAQRTVDADRAQVTSQQQLIAAATQSLQSITEVTGYLDIKAPFDGIVTERNAHPGALVTPTGAAGGADPILRIETVSRLRLVVPVPEAYAAGITEGRAVDFTVPSFPGRHFSGKVARLAHTISVKTRTMAVEIDVTNGAGELLPGTFCEVRWPLERRSPSLFVPTTSVASTLERTFVVRIRDGKAEWVDVKTGVTTGKLVEVFGDLQAGNQVAMRGTDELRPGAPIQAHLVTVQ